MPNEKILEEFDEKFDGLYTKTLKPVVDLESMLSGGVKTVYGYSESFTSCSEEIKSFLSEKLDQARTEERERIVNLAIKAKNRYEGLLASDALPGLFAFLKGKIMSLDDLLISIKDKPK